MPVLYRNDSITTSGDNGNEWLKIDTIGSQSNRDGIGARITIDPDDTVMGDELFQEVQGGSNFLAQSETTVHFGLGDLAGTIDHISILWPSGYTQDFFDVSPNQLLTITEGLLADFDDNDIVEGADKLSWEGGFGIAAGADSLDGDANRDGDVDGGDFLGWQRQFGQSIDSGLPGSFAAGASIPEPGTFALASLGLVGLFSRRR